MADLTLTTANKIDVIESESQATAPAASAVTAGAPVFYDTNGKFAHADANAAAADAAWGVATKTVAAGESCTAIRRGKMSGWSNLPAYGAPVFVSDTVGALGDAAGTASITVGHVEAVFSTNLGTAADKILNVNCTGTGSAA